VAFLDCDHCKSTEKKTMTHATTPEFELKSARAGVTASRTDAICASERQNWAAVERSLDTDGNAVLPGLLTVAQCRQLAALYPREVGYRSRVVMGRHGFGRGEYKYFAYPLPPLLEELRHALYPKLVPLANRWNEQLGIGISYPDALASFLERCHGAARRDPRR
jgi:hypothetical protein